MKGLYRSDEIPDGFSPIDLGGDVDIAPSAWRRYLSKYRWKTFLMSDGTKICIGQKGKFWHHYSVVVKLLNSKLCPFIYFDETLRHCIQIQYDKTSCWNWTGYSVYNSPVLWINSTRQVQVKQIIADRFMKARPDAVIGQKCGNIQCVRPSHLEEYIV